LAFRFFLTKVATLVGLPPTPCAFDRFLDTAERICDAVMLFAFDLGTHFGYFRFEPVADLRPHFWNLPFFFGAPMSTQSPFGPLPNHAVNPPVGLAITQSYNRHHVFCMCEQAMRLRKLKDRP
jgi:hypothetical protein